MKLNPKYFLLNWIGRYILGGILVFVGQGFFYQSLFGNIITIMGLCIVFAQFIIQMIEAFENAQW